MKLLRKPWVPILIKTNAFFLNLYRLHQLTHLFNNFRYKNREFNAASAVRFTRSNNEYNNFINLKEIKITFYDFYDPLDPSRIF